jgi:hypothetical protein
VSPPEVRAHPEDGRIAQQLWLDGGHYSPNMDRWVCVTAPGGQLQVNIMEYQDIADWIPLTPSDPP